MMRGISSLRISSMVGSSIAAVVRMIPSWIVQKANQQQEICPLDGFCSLLQKVDRMGLSRRCKPYGGNLWIERGAGNMLNYDVMDHLTPPIHHGTTIVVPWIHSKGVFRLQLITAISPKPATLSWRRTTFLTITTASCTTLNGRFPKTTRARSSLKWAFHSIFFSKIPSSRNYCRNRHRCWPRENNTPE